MPVSIARLKELIDLAASGGVDGLDMVEGGTHIRITRTAASVTRRPAAASRPTVVATSDTGFVAHDIFVAPMFGVLHMTRAPGAKPYVALGDVVQKGQQLCLIEAMKMFNAILSDRSGRLEAILAEPGSEVANGQPLFRIIGS